MGYYSLHNDNSIFVFPPLDILFFSRPDQTALSPTFSTRLRSPPAAAAEVSSPPEGLQATLIASRARHHLRRPAPGTSSGKTTATPFANAPCLSAEQSYCFELFLLRTVLMSLKVTPAGACNSETLLSETRDGGGQTQRQ